MSDIEEQGKGAAPQLVAQGARVIDETSLPTIVTNGNSTQIAADGYGRQIVVFSTSSGTASVNIASGTAVVKSPASTTISNLNLVVAAGTVLAANSNRIKWGIKNSGTAAHYVGCGTIISSSTYCFTSLKPGTTNGDGTGDYYEDTIWKGVVSIAAAGTALPRCHVWEMT